MAFQIIRHAFRMVFGNFGQALRLSVGPLLIAAIIIYGLASALDIGFVSIAFMFMNPAAADPLIAFFILVALVVGAFVSAWVAVSWHRFILLEEYTNWLPAWRQRPVGAYLLTSLGIGFWVFLATFLVSLLFGVLIAVLQLQNSAVAAAVVGFAVGALTSYVWFRLALSLPALSIGRSMKLRQSFDETIKVSATIWNVVFILIAINAIANVATGFVAPGSLRIQLALDGLVFWVNFMVGLSVLTTFYGHLIEDRELPN